ncbi:MAG: hypothetical protein QNJ68_10515 [Microcoleaceae cyanobacterium MO_207.B10]|nr:hypothetical protein [Microcoleaceae cyanobacterium MO_207.B10]
MFTEVEGDQAQIWLGGLDVKQIAELTTDAIFNLVELQEKSTAKLMFESPDSLMVIAKFKANIKPGYLLQLSVR